MPDGKINHLHRAEIRHGRKILIVSTIEFAPGRYETMVLKPNGTELECRRTRDISEAHRDYTELFEKYNQIEK